MLSSITPHFCQLKCEEKTPSIGQICGVKPQMGQTAGGRDELGQTRAGIQGAEPADQSDGRVPDDHPREGHGAAACQHLPTLFCGLPR